ncbi:MAG: Outer membrane protein assembly factor BamD [Myxococcota bacterium]|nr:Outer membrane protein assembly factor BamD [Myxococcota bacterium]
MRAVLAIVAMAAAGCSSPGLSGSYAENAKRAYDEALDTLDSGYYKEAIDYFTHVKSKFPYSSYATLAELRIADAQFKREKYILAADAYEMFYRLHPRHPEAGYALYQAGESHWERRPSEFFIFPPIHENDLEPVAKAVTAYRNYLKIFPDHTLAEQARKRIEEARTLLAKHEMYVAEFYVRRDMWKAAEGRLRGLRAEYSDLPLIREALLLLGDCYVKLDKPDEAREAYGVLARLFPDTSEGRGAQSRLADLPPPPENPADPRN